MQKPEFSLICDDTFYKIFSASILAFFLHFYLFGHRRIGGAVLHGQPATLAASQT